MGVLITIPSPESDSSWNKIRVYRSSTKTGTFGQIAEQSTSNLSYYDELGNENYWYKYSYYNSNSLAESDKSTPLQVINSYCSVKQVQNYLRLSTLTDTSIPTIQQVMDLIKRAEDILDDVTQHAWRLRYSGTRTGDDQTPNYEYYDMDFEYEYQTGRPLYLGHRKIRQFSAASGDVFEIWNGSAWEDFLALSEDRGGDWWCDYEKGIIYIKRRWSVTKPVAVRMKYRYGETVVPKDVEDACIKKVAIEIYTTEGRAMALPEGSTTLTYRDKIETWEKAVNDFIGRNKEFKVISSYL